MCKFPPQFVAGVLHCSLHAILLDVHVICVQVDCDIVHADIIDESAGLQSRDKPPVRFLHARTLS